MLTEITLDGKYLWSSDSMANDLIIPQSLKVEYNKAGSFSFVMLPTHPEYDNIHRMKSYVRVSIDDYEVFRGRVLDFSCDFYRRKTVTCEGDLAFLLDSIYPAIKTASSVTPDVFFGFLIAEHNRQMERDSGSEFKKLTVGNVSVSTEMDQASPETFENTSPRTTSDVIDDLLISKYGGFLITRLGPQSHITGEVFIDYISDRGWPAETGQNGDIAFGVNLLNLEYEPPIEEVFTAVMPVGYNKLTLSETFVIDNTAVQKYGFIAKTVQFEDCTTESKLRSEAQKYLAKYTKAYPDTLTVKAVDLVHLGQATRGIRLGDKVAVSSDPHGIEYDGSNAEKTVRCLAIEYDLTNPSNNTYVLGTYIPPDKKRKAPNVARSGGSARRASYSGSSFSGLGNTTFSGLQAPAMTEMIDKAKSTITSLSDEGGNWISGLADKAYGKLKEVFGGTNGLDTGTLWDFVSGGVNDLKAGIGNTVSNLTSGAGGDMLNNGFEGLKSGLESITGGATLSSKTAENTGLRETLTETKAELIEKHEQNVEEITYQAGRITIQSDRLDVVVDDLNVVAQGVIDIQATKIQVNTTSLEIGNYLGGTLDLTNPVEVTINGRLNAMSINTNWSSTDTLYAKQLVTYGDRIRQRIEENGTIRFEYYALVDDLPTINSNWRTYLESASVYPKSGNMGFWLNSAMVVCTDGRTREVWCAYKD